MGLWMFFLDHQRGFLDVARFDLDFADLDDVFQYIYFKICVSYSYSYNLNIS